MNYSPSENIGSGRTGTLQNITEQEIESIFGFPPNVDDDPWKVVNSWAVDVEGATCYVWPLMCNLADDGHSHHTVHVWDYKGSHHDGQFSTDGNPAVLKQIFGDRYVSDR